MGEAKRRAEQGEQRKAWRGPLPDALFVRMEQARLPLTGYLHVLSPPADDEALIAIAAKLADQLMYPERLPAAGGALPLWLDERDAWNYGLDVLMAIKQKLLADARVVHVAMLADDGEQCQFVYSLSEKWQALTQLIADGLSRLRPN